MQVEAQRPTGPVRAVPDLTPAGVRAAQKKPQGVSWYSLLVNRPAGARLAVAFARTSATPDQVTCLSGLVSFSGVALLVLAPRTLLTGLLAGALLLLGFALDAADGQLARLTGTGSPAGEWLDHVLDCALKLALHGAVLVVLLRDDADAGLAVPLAFLAASVMLFVGGTLAAVLLRHAPVVAPARAASPLRRWLLLPVDHGTVSACFLLWGLPGLFSAAYAVLLVAHLAGLAVLGRRWRRELRAAA